MCVGVYIYIYVYIFIFFLFLHRGAAPHLVLALTLALAHVPEQSLSYLEYTFVVPFVPTEFLPVTMKELKIIIFCLLPVAIGQQN